MVKRKSKPSPRKQPTGKLKRPMRVATKPAKPVKAAKRTATKPKRPRAVPEGFSTLTPHLIVDGAGAAMDFYKTAFGALELGRMPMPDGKRLMHAVMSFGNSMLFLVDAFEEMGMKGPKALGGSGVALHLYVADVDAAFKRAVSAGCTASMPPADMFWGDRYAKVKDPFGHEWSMATHVRDMTPEEMAAAQEAAFAAGKPSV